MDDQATPRDEDIPGGFPESTGATPVSQERMSPHTARGGTNIAMANEPERPSDTIETASSSSTLPASRSPNTTATTITKPIAAPHPDHGSLSSLSSSSESEEEAPALVATKSSQSRPGMGRARSIATEDDLFKVLSRRRTNASGKSGVEVDEEHEEIQRLMSRMFGKDRQAHSEEEKTRHSGVIFRNLTVKGVGLGASLQPTVGDIFLGLPRTLRNLFTKGPKAAASKPPVRDLISDFSGCVKPGEMLLVLGRPGSGCTTFLKTFCNQRSGFEAVEGDVTYGGTDAHRMAKDFRGEVIYNPEDDLHYATLSVKRTLKFALQTRTPGKESRLEGESRADYMEEFLRVVTKLFWIGMS